MFMRFFFCAFICVVWSLHAYGAEGEPRQDKVLEQAVAPTGGDFTLQSVKGPVSTRDLRGKVILLYFGYTKCPDVCPTSLAFMTQALNELSPEELKNVIGIFVSVDPKRDTLKTLDEYVGYFHENYIGLTGSAAEVAEVAKLYGAQYYEEELKDSAFGYSVNHSSATYLIDRQGKLRFVFPHETPPGILLEAIRHLSVDNS